MSNDSALRLFSLAGNVNLSTERCCLAPFDYSSYPFASAISASLAIMGYTSSWNMDLLHVMSSSSLLLKIMIIIHNSF